MHVGEDILHDLLEGGGCLGGRPLLEQAADDVDERAGILGARYGPFSVDHVGGYGSDLGVGGERQTLGHLGAACVAGEEGEHFVAIHTHFGSASGQGRGIADIETFAEVGAEQTFFQSDLDASLLGEPEQAVGEKGVGAQTALEVEFEPFAGCHARDMADDLGSTFGATELLRITLGHGRWVASGGRGVELVGAVCDVEGGFSSQFVHRVFEASLPDVAPGANDVGPDLDRHGG